MGWPLVVVLFCVWVCVCVRAVVTIRDYFCSWACTSVTSMWTLKPPVSQYSFMQSSQRREGRETLSEGHREQSQSEGTTVCWGQRDLVCQVLNGWVANVLWRESRLELAEDWLTWSFLWWPDCRSSSIPELSTDSTLRAKTLLFWCLSSSAIKATT